MGMHVGPLGGKIDGVRRIAVVRGGGIGDLLFALPAIRALAAAYPQAEVVLLGSPVAAELLGNRAGAPHRVRTLPPLRGVGVPDTVDDSAAAEEIARFIDDCRAERFDLAVQLHGGGAHSNRLVAALGARRTIGARAMGAPALDRTLAYVTEQHEMMRWLEVVGLIGAAPVELEPGLAAAPEEIATARRRFAARGAGLVVVHPGASDPRRRWPAAHFAEVVAALVGDGADTVIVGDRRERTLCREVADVVQRLIERDGSHAPGRVHDVGGALSLAELVGCLAAADLMVGNDSGPRHLAQSLGTPTASIFWCGNLVNAGPHGRSRHRVRLSWRLDCPVCGRSCAPWNGGRECPHDASFVADVRPAGLLADARALLGDSRALRS